MPQPALESTKQQCIDRICGGSENLPPAGNPAGKNLISMESTDNLIIVTLKEGIVPMLRGDTNFWTVELTIKQLLERSTGRTLQVFQDALSSIIQSTSDTFSLRQSTIELIEGLPTE